MNKVLIIFLIIEFYSCGETQKPENKTENVEIIKTIKNEVIVETKKAEGDKCPVCWKISKNRCKRHAQ